jgi:fumarate hydratase subunit beta
LTSEIKRLSAPVLDDSVLYGLRSGDKLTLSGTLIVARDQVHKRLSDLIYKGEPLPFDPKGAVVYYMGPSPAPPGRVIGAAGPTTAGRMDGFTSALLKTGVKALVAKGQRSLEVREALLKNNAVYLGAVGGAGAFYGNLVTEVKVLAWPELGPEALLELKVKDFPVTVITDLFGGNLYGEGPEKWHDFLSNSANFS